MTKNNVNVKNIKTSTRSAFRYWLEFLRPYHKLRNKEIEALSLFLFYRHQLSLEVSNQEMVDEILFSVKTRVEIKKELNNMDNKIFNNLLTSLRKKGVLSSSNKIAPVLIPKIDSKGFSLLFKFNFQEEDEAK